MDKVNKYCHRSHISERIFRQVIRYFAMDLEATKIAELTGISRNSVNRILKALRKRLAEQCESQSPFSERTGLRDADPGARGAPGKDCHGSGGQTPVFGIVQCQDKVFTQIISDCPRKTLQAIVKGRVDVGSIIPGDGSHSSVGLVDLGNKRHYRMNPARDASAGKKSGINGIDNFWGIAKMRLSKFRGLNKNTFYLHVKETEFRFNHRNEDLYKLMLQMLRNDPLKLS
ncbi:MAG TPA: IS1595 family transposase [Deltaproteobacteria bacterium]|nr:IS1595 family transposase [Deltaproteobacteria bacterium]